MTLARREVRNSRTSTRLSMPDSTAASGGVEMPCQYTFLGDFLGRPKQGFPVIATAMKEIHMRGVVMLPRVTCGSRTVPTRRS